MGRATERITELLGADAARVYRETYIILKEQGPGPGDNILSIAEVMNRMRKATGAGLQSLVKRGFLSREGADRAVMAWDAFKDVLRREVEQTTTYHRKAGGQVILRRENNKKPHSDAALSFVLWAMDQDLRAKEIKARSGLICAFCDENAIGTDASLTYKTVSERLRVMDLATFEILGGGFGLAISKTITPGTYEGALTEFLEF